MEAVTSKSEAKTPPSIITVDPNSNTKEDERQSTSSSKDGSTARTPKHANKHSTEGKEPPRKKNLFPGYEDGRMNNRHSYPPVHGNPAIHISPTDSNRRYYGVAYHNNGGQYPPTYDQRFYSDYNGPNYHPQGPSHYGPPRMPMYPPRNYPVGNAWGPPPASFPPGRHPPSHPVSRAVSSSFDRSIKSREGRAPMEAPMRHDDRSNIPDDGSWKLLNQVHSVDEDDIQKRSQSMAANANLQPTGSNHSSLTNSPTEGLESGKKDGPDTDKLKASLESLTGAMEMEKKPLSPGGSTGSLDLMKCPSGSSQLLLPSHQRSLSQLSLPHSDSLMDTGKRTRSEENDHECRADVDTKEEDDTGRESATEPDTKRSRRELPMKKKGSPLSIVCSPPASPRVEKKKGGTKLLQPQPIYPTKGRHSPGFYDAPGYTYSMDLGQSSDRAGQNMTPTPMIVDSDPRGPPGLAQVSSWDLQQQDSFGAGGSVTGGTGGLMSSFSFRDDYPMLSASTSIDNDVHYSQREREHHQHIETRNQSFDSHYRGNFGRSDSMMSYERHGPYDGAHPGYPPHQQFPPHAPSWGSQASYHSGQMYPPHYRGGYPMMRSFSEDNNNNGRSTPPPGGMRMLPPGFQPPPEFLAPPSRVKQNVQENTILTSPYNANPKAGPFGWTKEEDARLTELMKKYKNPHDWEPIAKDHNRGRTAKECHERWIRYLKPGVRKGQWTDQEDAIVMEAVATCSEQPFTRWSDLAQRLPGRVGKQIRDRWVNHLNPNINHLPFSREDDLLLWEGHKRLGKRWVEIATKFFHSSRSENHIKNRWYSASFKKFITNEFGPDAYSGGKKKDDASPSVVKKKKPSSSSPRKAMEAEQEV
ncbi:hypothetical protein FisN_8Lh036 [Fistulifera solaris]|uniref:Myb proto-oncogene protein n=1 Tax=Fistulifera solaris TaxID=1519565 RepID=A0A1Z5JDU0_FISSO|nr:hypothetical protein FisN_8Lh036 [Fistulifera solaris]|eukprot:GAX11948.1 hypothetical protein FisN_8Lh036 [Fistulifera solaris]